MINLRTRQELSKLLYEQSINKDSTDFQYFYTNLNDDDLLAETLIFVLKKLERITPNK